MEELGRVLVLGGGAMGSALAHSFARSGCSVKILSLSYDKSFEDLCVRGLPHPSLGVILDSSIEWQSEDEVSNEEIEKSDLLVVAVSSEGLSWSEEWLEKRKVDLRGVMFATKGVTFYKKLEQQLPLENFRKEGGDKLGLAVLGGPCLAHELAMEKPSSLVVACKERSLRESVSGSLDRLPYVQIESTDRVLEVAWCAGLKNLYAIAVSAVDSANGEDSKNATSGVFVQSIKEMQEFLTILGLDQQEVSGLAGVGDLYVTYQGGRNGKFGRLLGKGKTRDEIINGEMKGVTIEGVHTAQAMVSIIEQIESRSKINWDNLFLMKSLLNSIVNGERFRISPWV